MREKERENADEIRKIIAAFERLKETIIPSAQREKKREKTKKEERISKEKRQK